MTKNKKMTYSVAIETAINTLNGIEGTNPEVLEKLTALKASLDKKNAAPRTLTAQQKKNEQLKEIIVAFLEANSEQGFTVTEIMKAIPEFAGDSNQHVSSLLRQLTNPDKTDQRSRVKKYSEKRRTYFQINQ